MLWAAKAPNPFPIQCIHFSPKLTVGIISTYSPHSMFGYGLCSGSDPKLRVFSILGVWVTEVPILAFAFPTNVDIVLLLVEVYNPTHDIK